MSINSLMVRTPEKKKTSRRIKTVDEDEYIYYLTIAAITQYA